MQVDQNRRMKDDRMNTVPYPVPYPVSLIVCAYDRRVIYMSR